jgi:hypothetical protein
MKLLVRILLSLCSLLAGVHTHTSKESIHGFPKSFHAISNEEGDSLQGAQAVVGQRRSPGERRTNDGSAEKAEESDDDDDDESRSSRRHTGPGSSYISSYSGVETDSATLLLNLLPAREHSSYFSSPRFIIHCVFRL